MDKGFKRAYMTAAVLLIACGIFMLLRPMMFAYALCYTVGGVCILHGIVRLVGYFSKELYRIAFQFDLALGIASTLLGLVIVFNSEAFMTIIPIIIGIFTLLSGALRIQSAIDAKRFGLSKWWILLVTSVAAMALGVFLIACPFGSFAAMVWALGATLILDGIQNLSVLLYAVKYR